MTHLAVNTVILRAGRVLLTQREDFEVWCLPGGAVDPGESLAEAAIREAQEETGYIVRLLRLVGMYSKPQQDYHVGVFVAEIVGGEATPEPSEVIAMDFFAPDALPEPMIAWHRVRLMDALNGMGGSAVVQQRYDEPRVIERRSELYQQRDESGLSRQAWYLATFPDAGEDRREV